MPGASAPQAMDSELPFGYTHRQKRQRSNAHMDAEGEPTWGFDDLDPAHANRYRDYSSHPEPHHDAFRLWSSPAPAPVEPPPGLPSVAAPAPAPTNPHPQPHSQSRPHPHPHPHPHVAGLHLPPLGPMADVPRRFEGDGLDYRRPVGWPRRDDEAAHVDLSGDDDVIDLTSDDPAPATHTPAPSAGQQTHWGGQRRTGNNGPPRLPRGMDIIIDLDNGEEEWRVATPPQQDQPRPAMDPGSPEIEFISSRRVDPQSREQSVPNRQNRDGDDVEFLRANPLPPDERRRHMDAELEQVLGLLNRGRTGFAHLRAHIERTHAQIDRTTELFRRGPVAPPRGPRGRATIRTFIAPVNMDFGVVGFDMGMGGNQVPEPPPPTYDAPAQAPEGFTRSPEEKDVLLCPNCDAELCTGEDEQKRQVWVIKHCGHAYCGECTHNRSAKRSAKGKEKQVPARTNPFKECVVDGCEKKRLSPKAMIQIFL